VETQTRKTGGKTSGGEHDGDLTNGDPLFFGLSEIAAEAKTPAAMERAGPGNEAVPPEPALGLSPGGYETGLSGGTGPEGEPENGEVRALEKGKTGDKTKTPGFPEGGGEDSGQNRDIRGLFSLDSRKSETPGGGKEAGGRSADPRSRDKRRDRINLEVRDLRTRDGFLPDSPAGTFSARPAAGQERPLGGTGEADITLEFRGDNPGGEAPDSAQNSWETRSAQSFEHILARELHENLNGDIVRHASMVLRDQGQGTIRLSLKPESLGNVKIRLEMAENKITGHIVVESEEALRAIEREVHSLEQSFRDSGFDGAKLDMSLAQDGGRPGDRWNGEETGRFFLSERMAASQYDAALEDPGLFAAEVRNGMYTRNGRISVNMLV
jgi:hypothetical protein